MTGAGLLAKILTPSDRLASAEGRLMMGGQDAGLLLQRFGSPLYVVAEDTLRQNYRRLHAAFAAAWPGPVTVMYAVKANNTLAIRAVLSQEGAGGDCFGLGELHACLAGGTDPARMVMNGSNKSAPEVEAAIAQGVLINIDAEDEIGLIERLAPPGRRVPVNLRLKPLPPELDSFSAAFFKAEGGMAEAVRRTKWGYSAAAAAPLVHRICQSPALELRGYSAHVGRFSERPEAFAAVASGLGRDIVQLHAETGFWPGMLDIGGGWPRQREPESRGPAINPHSIEDYAVAAAAALLGALGDRPIPALWLEPGRYLVGNAVTLLTTAGTIKRDLGLAWVHVDASTNNLMRIDTSRAWHHILPATRMDAPMDETVQVVGGTCIPSVLGADRMLPHLHPGDVLAVLDAGMYAEAISTQFNALGRPASVMVSADGAHLVKRRETVADLFAHHLIPGYLQPGSGWQHDRAP